MYKMSTKISVKFVPNGLINNFPPLVQIMSWRRPGDKALSEPMVVSFLTHICVTWHQWVKICFTISTNKSVAIIEISVALKHFPPSKPGRHLSFYCLLTAINSPLMIDASIYQCWAIITYQLRTIHYGTSCIGGWLPARALSGSVFVCILVKISRSLQE